ncbi:filamentous hemagglutinin N-terminal domain-containing protein [Leptolyngbya cf. ectocarpi LEGE 11479]|uniref:Filamentous hemagglutinin N-terminal domain-containing protein n=1 Tax=Leptolyngbya cf. ectocarpi LEGE 11479 TaxID=1828722 RepID=A0A928X2K7_LEPEC|nr:filamentous hemagglutinin N-terminal domain-containing protein [Leptolyngbya ectocarpi]MBE9066211.1 filamentous hemagglutinin N-terminal domain-containing protein [Leptolyngbya cf. ectocarpi LEGE 11479]
MKPYPRQLRRSAAGSTLVATCGFALSTTLIYVFPQLSSAQIIPDGSLGANPSVVVSESAIRTRIDGGVQQNTALFHSFQDFNIDADNSVYFANPADVEAIFTRVTGTNLSQLDGTLGVLGTADLFLLNPNGIIFGPDSHLDISGSLTASTAGSFEWSDGSSFSAVDPAIPPTLTVSLTPGVQQGLSERSADIIQAGQLTVGQDLLLVADNIDLQGRLEAGRDMTLTASDTLQVRDGAGRLFGIVADRNTTINTGEQVILKDSVVANDIKITTGSLTATDGARLVIFSLGGIESGNVNITADGTVIFAGENTQEVSGIENRVPFDGTIDAGDISITANRLELLNGAVISASTSGEGDSGKVTIAISETTLLEGEDSSGFGSGIFSQVNSAGRGNSRGIFLSTGILTIRNGGEISATSRGQGDAGTIQIIVRDMTSLDGFSSRGLESGIFSNTDIFRGRRPIGDAGNIFISTGSLSLTNNAFISSNAFGIGKAGSITIQARDNIVLVGSFERSATTQSSSINTQVADTAISPEGGNISITARSLDIINGGRIGASTFGKGNAGNISINASESISLEGVDGFPADGILSAVYFDATGDGGEISINTGSLSLSNTAGIQSFTQGEGNGGQIIVNADTMEITTGGRLISSTFSSSNAGSIQAHITDSLTIIGEDSGVFAEADVGSTGNAASIFIDPRLITLRDSATIGVRNQGTGIGGNVGLVSDQLILDNNASISAETASNQGGNITLLIDDLVLLRNSSNISTTAGTAGAEGDGGNVTIDTNFLVSPFDEDNNITANADLGRGGRIQITASGVYGIENQANEIPVRNDITASSNANLDGEVNVNTLDLDPTRDTTRLPSDTGAPAISQRCNPGQGVSSFVATGRGGVPLGPEDAISPQTLWEELYTPSSQDTASEASPTLSTDTPTALFTEAQSWDVNAEGDIVLTAGKNHPSPRRTAISPTCSLAD